MGYRTCPPPSLCCFLTVPSFYSSKGHRGAELVVESGGTGSILHVHLHFFSCKEASCPLIVNLSPGHASPQHTPAALHLCSPSVPASPPSPVVPPAPCASFCPWPHSHCPPSVLLQGVCQREGASGEPPSFHEAAAPTAD